MKVTISIIWSVKMDNIFYISAFFILVTGLVSTFFKSRKKDRCLMEFDEFDSIVNIDSKKEIYGDLKIYSTGFELVYSNIHDDDDGHTESSYIMYSGEFSRINHIRRDLDSLSDSNKKDREDDIYNTFNRVAYEKLKRRIANIFSSIRDYVIKIFEMSLGQMKKSFAPGSVFATQDKYIAEIGKNIIGYSGNSYEPVYEQLIGSKVVVEYNAPEKIEYYGVLKEYSESFIEILDTEYKNHRCDIIFPRSKALIRHRG